MSAPVLERPYVFDQTQVDHDRLVLISRLLNDSVREACLTAGLRPGDRALDVGCGPLGALPVLSALVGSEGVVVGLDMNAGALARARQGLASLGIHGVELIEADINALDPTIMAHHGPFDVAFCRLVFMYQRDPAATLRHVASVLRPGGRIVAIDVLHDPHYPYFDPPVPAAERIMRLFFALVERRGGTLDVAHQYRYLCEQANLRLVLQRGLVQIAQDPRDYLAYYRDVLLTMRDNLLALNISTDEEIAGLVQEMDAAQTTIQFGALSVCVEMIAEVQ